MAENIKIVLLSYLVLIRKRHVPNPNINTKGDNNPNMIVVDASAVIF